MHRENGLKDQYKGVRDSFVLYLRSYGGVGSCVRSPYLHIAAIISLAAYPIWLQKLSFAWFDLTISILPNILGFTLGGYAILLAFGDENFRKLISGRDTDGKPSPFMVLNGTFIHFILVQSASILLALVGKAWDITTGTFALIGLLALVYSITTAIAAALAVLNVSEWFDLYRSQDPGGNHQNDV